MTRSFITDPAPSFVYEEELGFSTLVSDFANGVEQRRDTQEQGKKLFRLRYNIQTPEEIDRLWNFYQLCKGKFRSFNFQSKAPSLMPYDQITAWLPLHEGTGTKLDDWNGFIYPTYSVRFVEDKLSYEQFSLKIRKSDIAVIQESPISFTNNYGTLSGTTSFIQCPDGSAGVSFDGSSGQCSLGDAAALDVGTGDFYLAIALYTN